MGGERGHWAGVRRDGGAGRVFSSPLYVYFPAVVADYYGAGNSSGNYAALYTAKIGGGVFAGGVAGYLVAAFGWEQTFVIAGCLAIIAAIGVPLLRAPHDSEA